MTRRILRTGIQLCVLILTAICALLLLDNKIRVLPNAIHNRLPAHHPGFVITDIKIAKCSSINFFSSCKLDQDKWHRIEKDLYLGKGVFSEAYLHIARKREEDLQAHDAIIVDIKISRLVPSDDPDGQGKETWETRSDGIWIKRSTKRHSSDSSKAITGIDVLFGSDAVDPRPSWRVQEIALLVDTPADGREPHLSVRRGPAGKVEKPTPRINQNGKFKIMQVADLHLSTGLGKCRDAMPVGHNGGKCDADVRTMEFVEKMIEDEKPDLAILSGDQVNGETAPDSQSAIFKYAEVFKRHKLPFAGIFGNHDDEGDLDREASMAIMQDLPFSLSDAGPTDVDGVGNYLVEVLGRGSTSHSALTLYLIDSHSYSPDERHYRGYDWVKPSQIKWFKQTSQMLKKKHNEYTLTHMDMAFMHIPLPEYRNPDKQQWVGNWTEAPTAPGFNSGLKDAFVEEGVVLVSCGHDHVNDYCIPGTNADHKPAIWMCYGGAVGFGGYGGYGGYHRRIRFFEIDMNEARINTYKRLEWGDTAARKDEQIAVDRGKVVLQS